MIIDFNLILWLCYLLLILQFSMLAVNNFQGIFTQLKITIIIMMITKIVITITIMVKVIIIGVANGKYKPLQDGKTSIFLCKTETF